jgi:UDP-N-acetylmuramate dehydrogenase
MQVLENFRLKKYNTFGIDVTARYFTSFTATEELVLLLHELMSIPQKMILGGGSNILFTKNFEGLVLKNDIPGIAIVNEDEDFVYLEAGAGVNWHTFVTYCVDNNYGGVENLSLIPGNVGATPMQNIGAYGVEIKDVFYELQAFDILENVHTVFNIADCEFGYRESVFKKRYKERFAILNVTFRLRKNPVFNISYGAIEEELKRMRVDNLSVKAIPDAIVNIRTSKLPNPALIGNAGSFFKNPEISKQQLHQLKQIEPAIPSYKINDDTYKIAAAWLIEQCGWKGYRKGDAGCYEKQALVLVNYGAATGNEIYNLSEEIRISVKEKFGIALEREVNIL